MGTFKKLRLLYVFFAFMLATQLNAAVITYTVNTVADNLTPADGFTTLREAITAANALPVADEAIIRFSVAGTITLNDIANGGLGELPVIINEVRIDGTTAPGYSASSDPVIVIDGSDHLSYCLYADHKIIVLGIAIRNYTTYGIKIENNLVQLSTFDHVVITNINNGASLTPACGMFFSNVKDITILRCRIGNNTGSDAPSLGVEDYGVYIENSRAVRFGGLAAPGDLPDNLARGAVITNCGVTGIFIANPIGDYQNIAHNIYKSPIYNCAYGIMRVGVSNASRPIPVITAATSTTASGTCQPFAEVQVYASTGPQNANVYLGKTTATMFGTWSITGMSSDGWDNYCYYVAVQTLGGSSSEISIPFTLNRIECICAYVTNIYGNNVIHLMQPGDFSQADQDTDVLEAEILSAPPLDAPALEYTVHLMIAEQVLNASTGTYLPDWQNALVNTTVAPTYTSLATNDIILNEPISTYIPSAPSQPTTYFWKVGLEYSLPVNGHNVITWSTPYSFILSPPNAAPAAETYLTDDGQHTNDINWVYGVSYLDDGLTSEGIAYIDGLGKSRQVQSKLNSENKIMAVEAAYSEEGGGTVMTLPAPIQSANPGQFGYDYKFFDVFDGTNYHDFGTADFDREVVQASFNVPMSPQPVAANSSVAQYYSSANADDYVDDAEGYPYTYNITYNNPLQRPMLSSAGAGATFMMTNGREYQHYYGKPDSQAELDRVWGYGSPKKKDKIARTITYDPNGVGYLTYKDNEGKVIATAMTACTAPSLSAPEEDGMTGFVQTVNAIDNEILNPTTNEKVASSKFFIPCDEVEVNLSYKVQASAFSFQGGTTGDSSICMNCEYDVEIIITNEQTNETKMTFTRTIVPASSLCPGPGASVEIDLTSYLPSSTIILSGPANYLFVRKVRPHIDPSSGNSSLTNAIDSLVSYVQTNSNAYYSQFIGQFYSPEKYFVLRKEKVTNFNNYPGNNYITSFFSEWYAGSGPGSPGDDDLLPLVGSATYRGPTGVTRDQYGNMYIAENNGGTGTTGTIRQINANGIPTTVPTGTVSINPHDITFYASATTRGGGHLEYLVVSDRANDKILSVDPTGGTVTVLASSADGIDAPEGLSEQIGPTLFFTSSGNGKVFRYYDPSDTPPFIDEVATSVSFSNPSDVEVEPNSNDTIIYVSDRGTNKIYKIATHPSNTAGTILETYGSGSAGSSDNVDGHSATFNQPSSILYLNSFGTYTNPVLLVSEKGGHNIRLISLTGLNPVVTISGLSISGDVEGDGTVAKYNQPMGLTGAGSDIYLADEANNRIRHLHFQTPNANPCTTSCFNYVYYPDEVDFQQLSGSSYNITNLDGDPDGIDDPDATPPVITTQQIGDEFYNITLPAPTPVYTPLSSGNTFNNFVNAYAAHHMIPVADVIASIISMDSVTVSSPANIKALLEDHSLESPDQNYCVLRVKMQAPSCDGQCSPIQSQANCNTQCAEQLQALRADLEFAYNALGASDEEYSIAAGTPVSTDATMQQMVNPSGSTAGGYQALTAYQYANLSPEDIVLYTDFENRLDALNLFNMSECLSLCSGTPPAPCDVCRPGYSTCVMANLDEILQGMEYIVDHWNTGTPTVFPFTESQLFADYPTNLIPDPDIVESLGKPLFDFVADYVDGGATGHPLNDWNGNATSNGGVCDNCGNPTTTSGPNTYACIPPSTEPNLSSFPTFLIPVLEAANVTCDYEFNRCMAFSSGSTATGNFICQETISDSCYIYTVDTYGQEPYPRNAGNATWVTWQGHLSTCIGGAPVCNAANAVNQYKHDIVYNALATIYTSPGDSATLDSLTNVILTSTVTPESPPAVNYLNDGVQAMSIEETQVFMQNYINQLQCKLSCESSLSNEYQEWLEQLLTTTINNLETSYYNQCIAAMRDTFIISYGSSFYHYTLYNYDYGNNLVSTVPPEGIDYIDLSATPTRVPKHRMHSYYVNSSLYTLQAGSPDEIYEVSGTPVDTLTEYYYDKAGRLRFSQSPEQIQRGVATSKKIYSYIRYDNESRILQTGEYQGPTSPSTALADANNGAWPAFGAATFDEVLMVYDNPILPNNAPTSDYQQKYVRGRLSAVINYTSGTISYYSYDPHGRVDFTVQMYGGYGTGMQRYKTTDYVYKNLTSRVDQIIYQKWNAQEKFVHKYEYDDDYRLVNAQVSRDGNTWADAAEYEYYTHGPLKSTSLGHRIQNLDFVYNINGWLKAINDPTSITGAPNASGETTSSPTLNFAPDVFAEAINYYENDYMRTGVNLDNGAASVPQGGTNWANASRNLFNGNISSTVSYTAFNLTSAMRTGITNGSTQAIPDVLAQAYRYDYLNRLTNVYGEELTAGYASTSTTSITVDGVGDVYSSAITYDANGNIKSLKRNSYNRWVASMGSATSKMDSMTYDYDKSLTHSTYYTSRKKHNQLQYVKDYVNISGGEDIQYDVAGIKNSTGSAPYTYTNTATHKYRYDAKGRVTNDYESNIDISWNSFDKITKIRYNATGVTMEFKYNPQQQRIEKKVIDASSNITYDLYAYDANGILMATYKISDPAVGSTISNLEEFQMYGMGRLGTYRVDELLNGAQPENPADYSKQYFEITDHLGSVRAVVKGEKIAGGGLAGNADIVQLTDYHEFGMGMQGRSFTGEAYRFGYQGSEKETGVNGMYTTEFRALDARLGRWFMPDPVIMPWQSPYCSMDNNPIALTDVMGLNTIEQNSGGGTEISNETDCPGSGAVEQSQNVTTTVGGSQAGEGIFVWGASGVYGQSNSAGITTVSSYTGTPVPHGGFRSRSLYEAYGDPYNALLKGSYIDSYESLFPASIAQKMIEHYVYGSGHPVMLTVEQMKETHPNPVGINNPNWDLSEGEQFTNATKNMRQGESRFIMLEYTGKSNVQGSMGRYVVHIAGTLTKDKNDPNKWTFEGIMWWTDTWDFKTDDKVGRGSDWGDIMTEWGDLFIPGEPYAIFSPVISVKQSSSNEYLDFYQNVDNSPIANEVSKWGGKHPKTFKAVKALMKDIINLVNILIKAFG